MSSPNAAADLTPARDILGEMRAFAEKHGAYPDELEAYDEAIASLAARAVVKFDEMSAEIEHLELREGDLWRAIRACFGAKGTHEILKELKSIREAR